MLIKFKIIFLFFLSLLFSQEDGYDLYKNKNYDAAIQYYDNLINSNKKVPEANYGKGSSSYMQGDYDSALAFVKALQHWTAVCFIQQRSQK